MQNPKLAQRYALAVYGLAKERSEDNAVLHDMEYLLEVFKSNADFKNFTKSPIINADKKNQIFDALFKGKLSTLSMSFIQLLTKKGREYFLEEIAKAFIQIYNRNNNIKTIRITSAQPLSDDTVKAIMEKVQQGVKASEIKVETKIQEDLIGGFVLEYEDKLFDASIRRDLNDISKQFSQNLFIHNIR